MPSRRYGGAVGGHRDQWMLREDLHVFLHQAVADYAGLPPLVEAKHRLLRRQLHIPGYLGHGHALEAGIGDVPGDDGGVRAVADREPRPDVGEHPVPLLGVGHPLQGGGAPAGQRPSGNMAPVRGAGGGVRILVARGVYPLVPGALQESKGVRRPSPHLLLPCTSCVRFCTRTPVLRPTSNASLIATKRPTVPAPSSLMWVE